jgi:hypothetical protein
MSTIALCDDSLSSVDFPRTCSPRTGKPISPKRLAANRANAKKSTGPRTPQGKSRSSQNALKHGLYSTTQPPHHSTTLSLPKGICQPLSHLPCEDDLAFQTFTEEMRQNLRPKTPLQQTLFDQIVSTRWRLDRLAEAQSHLFTTELLKLDPQRHAAVKRQRNCRISPSELLAQRFSDDKSNGFILMERYERGLTNTLLRLQRAYDKEQKLRAHVPDNDPPPPKDPPSAWSPERTRIESIACARARQRGRSEPLFPEDYPKPHENLEQLEEQLLAALTSHQRTTDHGQKNQTHSNPPKPLSRSASHDLALPKRTDRTQRLTAPGCKRS